MAMIIESGPTMSSEIFHRYDLTLPSGPEASGDASEWARAMAEGEGMPEDHVYALDTCVVELVSNIVNHGYRGAEGDIRLQLDLGPANAVLTLFDRAPEFDPLSVPAHVRPASIEEAKVGGLGIHLVRSMSQRCEYQRRDGENVFTVHLGAK
jgi:anti-sigma regulatory factor (Ser/Thr protein kinase)